MWRVVNRGLAAWLAGESGCLIYFLIKVFYGKWHIKTKQGSKEAGGWVGLAGTM